jgi:thioredoxin reductase
METNFDVIIVGGSYAGLSAGMALGRSLRNVLIIDSGSPCNIQTPHSHNLITHDGETPSNIAKRPSGRYYNTKPSTSKTRWLQRQPKKIVALL